MDILTIIALVVGIVVAATPLVIALAKYLIKCFKDKNWKTLMANAFSIIAEAERLYSTGAEKKEYAIKMIAKCACEMQYTITEEEISNLVEQIITVTKLVNVKKDN